jgi:hypothetical protein
MSFLDFHTWCKKSNLKKKLCFDANPTTNDLIMQFLDKDWKIVFIFLLKELEYYKEFIQLYKTDILNILARLTNFTIFIEAVSKGFISNSKEELYINAVLGNNLKILEHYNNTPTEFYQSTCDTIVETKNLEMLKWIKGKYKINHTSTRIYEYPKEIAMKAINKNNLEMIKWLQKNKCCIDSDVLNNAARKGNYDIFMFIHKKVKKLDKKTMDCALYGGNVNIVKYLIDKQIESSYAYTMICAAESSSLELLKYLFENGHQLHNAILINAAKNNCLDIIEWAYSNGSQLFPVIICTAAEYGNITILDWCDKHNCPKPDTLSWTGVLWIQSIAKNGHQHVIEWLLQKEYIINAIHKICYYATFSKNIEFIKWLRNKGFSFVTGMLKLAIDLNLNLFFELCKLGCPFDIELYRHFIIQGKYSAIKHFLIKFKCSEIYVYAAELGRFDIITLAFINNCIPTEEACDAIVIRGDIQILTWAIVNKFPLSYNLCDIAYKHGHLHIVKYLIELGLPCSKEVFKRYNDYYNIL